MLVPALALLNLTATFPHTSRFLKEFEASEDPSYINVIKFDNSLNFDVLLKELHQPKIVLDFTLLRTEWNENNELKLTGLDHLNLEELKGTPTLMHNFNRLFATIIFIENISKLRLDVIEEFLSFTKLSTILVVSENENQEDLDNVMKTFYNQRFLNVLHLDFGTFEDTQMIMTFESFPNYKLTLKQQFEKEEVTNIRRKEVQIVYIDIPPYTIFSQGYNKKLVGGIMTHFYRTFVRFINGNLIEDVRAEKSGIEVEKAIKSVFIGSKDFIATVPTIPLSIFQMNYQLLTEMNSDALDSCDIVILVPKSKPLEKKLYLVKIFSPELWVLTLIFVVYASASLSIYHIIAKKKTTFWRTFCQLFRCSLGQSFPYTTTNSKIVATFYMICILFGFILTTWFSAILGSFVTTTLYSKQARTLEDMRVQNIKIKTEKDASYYANFKEIRDLIRDREVLRVPATNEDAILVSSHVWHYFTAPVLNKLKRDDQYFQSDVILERSFLRVPHKYDSEYKEQVNSFIGLVKDYGLYQHWCDLAPWETLVSFGNPHYSNVEKSPIEVIRLEFLTYPFWLWFIGLSMSCVTFLIEIALRYLF